MSGFFRKQYAPPLQKKKIPSTFLLIQKRDWFDKACIHLKQIYKSPTLFLINTFLY